MRYDEEQLKDIFFKVKQTLFENSSYSQLEFDKFFDAFKNYKGRILTDNEYYKTLSHIVFYSGMKASTVDKYIKTIDEYFSDYSVAMKYDNEKVNEILSDTNMIKHKKKILACVSNAKQFAAIINEHGSFANYIQTFNSENDREVFKLKKELEQKFGFLSVATSCHFLMDIGFDILKPDRVILRVFYRLGFIDAEDDYYGAVRAGRSISRTAGLPIRYIDIIFVNYGQMNQPKITSICTEKNPKCNLCLAADYCEVNL